MRALDYAHRRLVNALGPERVAAGELERMTYSHDFASLPKVALLQWRLYPDFVVLPQTTEEVCRLVELADETRLPLVPRGSGSGMVGGAVPNRGGVVVDMRRMNRILSLDPDALTLSVEAGATWREIVEFVEARGFALPVVPAGSPASTIGGAYNSGSPCFGSYRHGSLLDQVLELEVVLPDGKVIRTGAAGDGGAYSDLKALYFGAEGTLGIVTKAVLRLVTKPEEVRAMGFAFRDLKAGVRFLQAIVDSGVVPYHVDVRDRNHFVFERAVRADGPDPADIVLAVLSGPKDEVAEQAGILDGLATGGDATKLDGEVAASLWDRRYVVYSARRVSRGLLPSHSLVPVARLEDGVAAAARLIDKLSLQGAITASLLNPVTAVLSPYVLMDDTSLLGPTSLAFAKRMGDAAFRLGGHPVGLGLLMTFNLRKMHGHATATIGSVKEVIDPDRKINGGKTIECWSRYTWPFIRTIYPRAVRLGLEVAAFLRWIKPIQDKFVRPLVRGGV